MALRRRYSARVSALIRTIASQAFREAGRDEASGRRRVVRGESQGSDFENEGFEWVSHLSWFF